MANIIDYMDWRGDILMKHSALNEVDGLIFSQFAYVPFDGLIENGFKEYRTIEELGKHFFEVHPQEEIDTWTELLKSSCSVLRKMIEVPRFKDLRVFNYCSEFEPEISKQFAAITIEIDRNTLYVAFRGTDDSLAGWEEDFKACYMMPVAAQQRASEYLKEIFEKTTAKVYLGGHSKGGNLAVYAAMKEGSHNKKRVIRVQNYDGPGFLQEFVESPEYKKMMPLTDNYNPRASIVGLIMFRGDDYTVVESSEKGLMQHTGISWQVFGNHFVKADGFDKFCLVFSKANKTWINEIEQEKREMFIEIVFGILKDGFDTVTGLKDGFFSTAASIIKSYNGVDKDTRRMARKILGQVIRLSTASYKETKKEQKILIEKSK